MAELILALVESIPDALLPSGEEGLETVGEGLATWLAAEAQAQGIGCQDLAMVLGALCPWIPAWEPDPEWSAAGEAAGFVPMAVGGLVA